MICAFVSCVLLCHDWCICSWDNAPFCRSPLINVNVRNRYIYRIVDYLEILRSRIEVSDRFFANEQI